MSETPESDGYSVDGAFVESILIPGYHKIIDHFPGLAGQTRIVVLPDESPRRALMKAGDQAVEAATVLYKVAYSALFRGITEQDFSRSWTAIGTTLRSLDTAPADGDFWNPVPLPGFFTAEEELMGGFLPSDYGHLATLLRHPVELGNTLLEQAKVDPQLADDLALALELSPVLATSRLGEPTPFRAELDRLGTNASRGKIELPPSDSGGPPQELGHSR